jgi:hypothetical protein
VSDAEMTLLYTDAGVFDLAMEPDAKPGIRAFLLSLAGGGDLLLWWLAERDCDPALDSACEGLEIEVEPHDTVPSVAVWEISEPDEGISFKARVKEYQPGTLLPRIIAGTLYPDETTVYLKYSHISDLADPTG